MLDETNKFSSEDIEQNKLMGGLAYFIFFLPLLVCPDSKFARFHANQSLLLLILSVAGTFILGLLPIIGWLLLFPFSIFLFILYILGLINGFSGQAKRMPLFGNVDLLK
ncbi:hypothetical protein ACWOFR_09755 [Carnobacterium gallinarum]|uniref:membrane protein n=1 Tax=Carnobacterium gallinarum TaxID=2749 RepID=UPI00054F35F5|nr:membrane protein [Carnobacterium gallinarum]